MKKMCYIMIVAAICAACNPKEQPIVVPPTDTVVVVVDTLVPSPSKRQELYRPQVHYTVHHNWSNDPNGLVYKDGVWHLYYQYNPDGVGCDFGRMSWGHAESKDLIHWAERATVLYPDEMGAMFSGSSVVDTDNRAGFGAGAILAYYTASAEKQLICLAVSTDGGASYQKYAKNPIIPSVGLSNFRDPKVVWDKQNQQYVMVIAKGWDQGLEFWRSTNLIDWQFVPYIFHADQHRCNLGQYECPDLLPMTVVNAQTKAQETKWVLVLSTMPGGYITGSGTMYFVGQLTKEGYFLADEDDYPRWLDYGADCYASVSWNNAPDDRIVNIGWLNNWDYAPAVPTTIWKSSYTIPRECQLRQIGEKLVLCSEPVKEIETIALPYRNLALTADSACVLQRDTCLDAYELFVTMGLNQDGSIRLKNAYDEYFEVRIDSRCRKIVVDRSCSGQKQFSSLFAAPSMSAPIEGDADEVELRLIVDQSSVEIFADHGATCITNLVFPRGIYSSVSGTGAIVSAAYRPLQTIWQ